MTDITTAAELRDAVSRMAEADDLLGLVDTLDGLGGLDAAIPALALLTGPFNVFDLRNAAQQRLAVLYDAARAD